MAQTRVTVSLEGFEDVRRAVERVPEAARVVLSDVIAKSTFAVYRRVLATVPVDTGLLKSTITGTSRGLFGHIRTAQSNFYWRFIEYGTKYRAARPFLRSAAESETSAFLERTRQAARALERDFTSGGGLL